MTKHATHNEIHTTHALYRLFRSSLDSDTIDAKRAAYSNAMRQALNGNPHKAIRASEAMHGATNRETWQARFSAIRKES